jgi:hypothetical protein
MAMVSLGNILDDEHKAEAYEDARDFAATAVGDEHWDSDEVG